MFYTKGFVYQRKHLRQVRSYLEKSFFSVIFLRRSYFHGKWDIYNIWKWFISSNNIGLIRIFLHLFELNELNCQYQSSLVYHSILTYGMCLKLKLTLSFLIADFCSNLTNHWAVIFFFPLFIFLNFFYKKWLFLSLKASCRSFFMINFQFSVMVLWSVKIKIDCF